MGGEESINWALIWRFQNILCHHMLRLLSCLQFSAALVVPLNVNSIKIFRFSRNTKGIDFSMPDKNPSNVSVLWLKFTSRSRQFSSGRTCLYQTQFMGQINSPTATARASLLPHACWKKTERNVIEITFGKRRRGNFLPPRTDYRWG